MITKQDLDAANREAEQAHENAERFRTPVRFTQEQWNQALENVMKLQADLAASQKRECAFRQLLLDTRHFNLGVHVPNEWFIRRDKALSTPAPQGWVKLRWRPATERPDANRQLMIQHKDGSLFLGRSLLGYDKRWLYASELLEGGQ